MSGLTAKELSDLLAGASNGFVDVVIGQKDGKDITIPVRGVTAREYLIHVVRRFPAVKAMFTIGAKSESAMVKAMSAARKEADEAGVIFDQDAFLREYDGSGSEMEFLDAQIGSGPEATAAFMACAMDHPGNKQVEAMVLGMASAPHAAILSQAEDQTYGGDPKRFFAEVANELAGTLGRAMKNTTAGSIAA